MTSAETSTNTRVREEPGTGCLTVVLFVGASLWIIAATFLIHLVAWTTGQFLLYEETPPPWYTWVLVSWAHGLAVAVPVVLLALFTRVPRLRAAYQTWLVAVLFVFVLALARVFQTTQTQPPP